MAKNYYFILGVDPDATQDQIKSAYRREAKRCHPDLSGEGSDPFLAIHEAYEVLGDQRRREIYDEKLAREQEQPAARDAAPEPLRRARCPAEPLVPNRRPGGYRDEFVEPSFRSPFVEPYRRPWSDPGSPVHPGSRRGSGDVHVRLSLTPEEALRGGQVRVWIPARIRCPACRGSGGRGFFACPYCSGSGLVVEEFPVDVTFPGGVVDGATGSLSLDGVRLQDTTLTLHFSVRGW